MNMRRSDEGWVMNIQNFSVNDGEGIRTTVFLAGCAMRCPWCANPEGGSLRNPMTTLMSANDVLSQVIRQLPFLRGSGGGVTFSGGEPTFQLPFLRTLSSRLYDAGVSLALETCGTFSYPEAADVLQLMDLIFIDFKHPDPDEHLRWTGRPLALVLENLRDVAESGIDYVVRIPTIIGLNAEVATICRLLDTLAEITPGAKLEFLPYHTLGFGKYEALGRPVPSGFATPSEGEMDKFRELASERGLVPVSYR
ncbi:MAG: radical SAM protein [Propionibacteriaceae bacterium]|jgi:pyruvate formate lyase activating enzyme|nr:radical SAM protein [Propionibacteriaceae bacterium]